MNNQSYKVLRWGIGTTFIWIALLIFRLPEGWYSFAPIWIQDSLTFLPFHPMYFVAGFDLVIGIFLIANKYTIIASALAALHLLGLVVMLGFGGLSARDFGLFAAATAIYFQARSEKKDRKIRV